MNEEKLQNLIQETTDQDSGQSQFNVNTIAFHVHNGSDSNKISFTDLKNRFMILPYTMVGGSAATTANYSVFFTAPISMTLSGITEVHVVKGTNGSPVTLQIEKLTDSQAPGTGVSLLTTAFDLKGTINTVVNGQLVTTIGSIQLKKGDRLGLVPTGTLTAVSNVTVTLLINF